MEREGERSKHASPPPSTHLIFNSRGRETGVYALSGREGVTGPTIPDRSLEHAEPRSGDCESHSGEEKAGGKGREEDAPGSLANWRRTKSKLHMWEENPATQTFLRGTRAHEIFILQHVLRILSLQQASTIHPFSDV